MELLIGCGHSREKHVRYGGRDQWDGLVTLDRYAECEPDVLYDLDVFPYPFDADQFDEIHAYCVLEHCGRQGDWRFFFDQWAEFWRIVKPNGTFHAIVPIYSSPWAWGDPSHTRIISPECLTFLSQQAYRDQAGKTSMSDFRWYYRADWTVLGIEKIDADRLAFVLRAIK